MNSFIVPVCNQDGVQATGFIINYKGYPFLITAAHPFPADDDVKGFYFIYSDKQYFLENFKNRSINFQSDLYKKERKEIDYVDFALFDLSSLGWKSNMELQEISQFTEGDYDCFGFNPHTGLLENEPRRIVDLKKPSTYNGLLLKNC